MKIRARRFPGTFVPIFHPPTFPLPKNKKHNNAKRVAGNGIAEMHLKMTCMNGK